MYPLGHLGITLFIINLLSLSLFYGAIGALLPDLIDKPLNIVGITSSGRTISHTLIAGMIVFSLAYLLTKNKKITISLTLGYYLHLIEDLPFLVPWFYPFVSYDFPIGFFTVRYGLYGVITDSIGLLLLIVVFYMNKDARKALFDFIKDLKNRIKEIK